MESEGPGRGAHMHHHSPPYLVFPQKEEAYFTHLAGIKKIFSLPSNSPANEKSGQLSQ